MRPERTLGLLTSPFTIMWAMVSGVFMMSAVVAIQGRTHGLEREPPLPFTFPRFLFTGGRSRAWRASK